MLFTTVPSACYPLLQFKEEKSGGVSCSGVSVQDLLTVYHDGGDACNITHKDYIVLILPVGYTQYRSCTDRQSGYALIAAVSVGTEVVYGKIRNQTKA